MNQNFIKNNEFQKFFNQEIIEAEKGILTALVNNFEEFINRFDIDLLKPEFFVNLHARKIFEEIKNLATEQKIIDFAIILNYLKSRIQTDSNLLPTLAYLQTLNGTGSILGMQNYLKILEINFWKESLNKLSSEIINSELSVKTFDSFKEKWKNDFEKIVSDVGSIDYFTTAGVIEEYNTLVERVQSNAAAGLKFLKTNFEKLDKKIKGLIGGQLLILAARPGIGKTTFAINLVVNNIQNILKRNFENDNKTTSAIGFFSLEMTKESLLEKMVSIESKIPLYIVKRPLEGQHLVYHEKKLVDQTIKTLAETNILFCDEASITLNKMANLIRLWHKKFNLKFVIIDYLQLINYSNDAYSNNLSQQQKIANISRRLKLLTNDLNICIIALAQLNRKTEERKAADKAPILSDLRESGSIEQDADIVMFLYQEDDKISEAEKEEAWKNPEIILKIAKNRHGEIGNIKFKFNKENGTFQSLENTINEG